jgi:hypothetical protein
MFYVRNYKDAAPMGWRVRRRFWIGENDPFANPTLGDSGAGAFLFDLAERRGATCTSRRKQ